MTIEIYDYEQGDAILRLQEISRLRTLHVKACIEAVHSMPKQGVASSFKFGKNAGIWEGRLEALNIPFDLVTPQKWKKATLGSVARKGVDPKDITLGRARNLFPSLLEYLKRKKDHNRAEALLIAKYCLSTMGSRENMVAIGIDPGETGAIAILWENIKKNT